MALERLSETASEYLYSLRQWNVGLAGESRSTLRAKLEERFDTVGESEARDDDAEAEDADSIDGSVRTNGDMVIEGYGAVFDSASLPIFGMFTEKIARGAFRKVLASSPDVRLLANHDGLPYARTSSGSMTVSERPEGLHFEAQLTKGTRSSDVFELVDAGTVSQCSFAFRVALGGDTWACECGDPLGPECRCSAAQVTRTIIEVSDLPEISLVAFPAYPETSVQAHRVVTQEAPAAGSVQVTPTEGPAGERNAQGSDEQQREVAPDSDASLPIVTSDPLAYAYRVRILRLQGSHNERNYRGARARAGEAGGAGSRSRHAQPD